MRVSNLKIKKNVQIVFLMVKIILHARKSSYIRYKIAKHYPGFVL